MFIFFIDYIDGTSKVSNSLSIIQAKRRYNAYNKRPESTAKSWGWEEEHPYTLSQQLRQGRT
jgi:hypothetical protein